MARQMVLMDPHISSSPAIVELAGDNQFRAITTHLLAHIYVTRFNTDGFIHRRALAIIHGRKRDAARLVDAGLWADAENGWLVVDWSRNQLHRPRVPVPRYRRDVVMARDGYHCQGCGTAENLSIDHIVPWSQGGNNTIENLQVLCRPCNSRKGAR